MCLIALAYRLGYLRGKIEKTEEDKMTENVAENEKEMKIKDNVQVFDIKTIFNIKTYDATLSFFKIRPLMDGNL